MATVSQIPGFKRGDEVSLSRPAGHLFGKVGLLLLAAILLMAAWFNYLPIVILAAVVLSAAGLAKVWSWCSLARVHHSRSLSEQRVFPGEQIELTLRVINRKPLPLPWLEVEDELPRGLPPANCSLAPGSQPTTGYLSNTASLFWYRGVSWRYSLYCLKRGYYSLGPARLSSGDVFGLYPCSRELPQIDHVIVYPRLFPLAELGLPSQYPLGEAKATRRIFQDPSRTIGIRPHTPHDPLRYIHWKASAREQHLQVKVFEPTTTLQVILFLSVDSFEQEWQADSEGDFELAVSTVASVANHLIQRRNPVGLFVNTRLLTSDQPVRMLPSSNLDQMVNILEALAKTVPLSSGPFEDFLEAERGNLPWGATLVLAVSKPWESLLRLVTTLREAGHSIVLLQVRGQPSDGHGVTCYNIRRPSDLRGPQGTKIPLPKAPEDVR